MVDMTITGAPLEPMSTRSLSRVELSGLTGLTSAADWHDMELVEAAMTRVERARQLEPVQRYEARILLERARANIIANQLETFRLQRAEVAHEARLYSLGHLTLAQLIERLTEIAEAGR